jgi:microsomal dipeptidase-like Zn-dependent dipeptidase
MRRFIFISLALFLIVAVYVAPAQLEKNMNIVLPHADYSISNEADKLHQTLTIGDLHSDSTLWARNLLERSGRGHVDIPRMREGNVALQMFTSVTKSPRGQNYAENSAEAGDNITLLAIVQRWPLETWNSLTGRALYQAEKLHQFESSAPEELIVVKSGQQVRELLRRRKTNDPIVGGILGIEGSHALDGKLENIQVLYDAGFRMMGLQHFFDNKLGGSLHGESGVGLTDFGRQAVKQMQRIGVIVDVAHSSEQVVKDVLQLSTGPLIVSHTGFYGNCPSDRNINDELMVSIASAGGIIGVGYWDAAVCDATPQGIIKAIRYGIDLVGVDHVALGSDYDGSIAAPFDTSELAVLTHEMLVAEFSVDEIRKVMGGNMMRFFETNLPTQ